MILPPWDSSLTTGEAMALQERLRDQVVTKGSPLPEEGLVAGADCSTRKGSNRGVGAIVVLSYPQLEVVETGIYEGEVTMPYIPGLLSFRELPLLLGAFERLKTRPHVIIVDGNGVAHPRGLGIASHLGITIQTPTVGCAKSRFLGTHDEPGYRKGARVRWHYRNRTVGMVVRTRDGVKPVYVSVGHLVSLEEAVSIVLGCTTRYRLPEPIRQAHRRVSG